jgi:steroid delta-isomerase-like uncharacterized protein
VDDELRRRREEVVREHMASENRQDFDATIGTLAHPHYEICPTGEVFDGEEEVRGYWAETRTAFPDQRNEIIALHSGDDAVVAEFWLRGTHTGPLRRLPPTGREYECRMTAVFEFEGDRISCERVYFDLGTILRQLGLASDPQSLRGRAGTLLGHPVTIGRAVARQLGRR